MIEVEMSKDIRSFQPKFLGPFTFRQAVCFAISALYGIPFMIFFTPLQITDRITVGFFLMIPVIACGYLKLDGMNFEIYIIRYVYWMFLAAKKRKYKTQNTYKEILNQIIKEEKNKEFESLSPKEQKAALKQANKPKVIQYSEDPSLKVYS